MCLPCSRRLAIMVALRCSPCAQRRQVHPMDTFRDYITRLRPASQRTSSLAFCPLAILLLVALVMSACASAATATSPAPGKSNTLRQAALPPGFSTSPAGSTSAVGSDFFVSADNGDVAYACIVSTTSPSVTVPVWLTRDRAAHWTQVETLTAPRPVTSCGVTPDDFDTGTADIVLDWKSPGAQWMPSVTVSYVTTDAGAHWQKLTGTPAFVISDLATRDGRVYALRTIQVDAEGTTARRLSTSDDHFRTWHPIDSAIADNFNPISGFWADPTSNTLLASVDNGPESSVLWSSNDDGAHWQQFPLPIQSRDAIIAEFTGNVPARICESSLGSAARSEEHTSELQSQS